VAIGDNYASLSELKAYLGPEVSGVATFDAALTDALNSTRLEIEQFCFRQFNDAGSASARTYDPISPYRVVVDDFHTITGLVIKTDEDGDGVFEKTWTTADYRLRPLNGTRNGVPGWPYWMIEAKENSSLRFPKELESVQVTARWGWASVPPPVKQATLIIAAKTHQLKDAPLGVAGMGQFGVVRVVDDRIASGKLRRYVKRILMK
jgi:hypothetical protein